ncbi:MAG: Lipid A export ATP-binding/permease protein MsbA [uncultured Thermomicrobiales bacterium]|uniref:Lipid A export ATP-binding/permease protein MsbA n=1 Tax=uncultured Thermomicrobiales bacterium TaxID=1645740 RepID=A0A6J4UY32_9BACT|nr:MAG: Lipid A export ATP-binding/permease protein MsbA [uncultured Thermomicrobiales bacterium]
MIEGHSVRYLLRRLLGLMATSRGMTAVAAVSILTSIGFALAQPLLIRALINSGIVTGNRRLVLELALAILVVAALSAVSAYLRAVTTQSIGERVSYDLRSRLFQHLEALPFSFYDAAQTGQLLSTLTEDVRNIRRFYSPALRALTQTVVLVFGSGAIMLWLNWRLALVALAMVPVLLALTLFYGGRVRPRYLRTQRQFGQAMTVLQENLAGTRLVRAFSRERYEEAKFAAEGNELYARQLDAARLSTLANANLPLVTGVATALVIGVGGWQVVQGAMQVGTLLAFYLYLQQLTDPIRQIGPIMNNVALALASTERVYEVLTRRPRLVSPPDPYQPTEVRGHVTFDEVTFGYGGGRPVLRGVSIDAPPGTVVGLVGATGSGKSSVVSLIARFYDVSGGTVLVDGVDVRRWDLATLRASVGFVLQETFLFSDSIRENIAYGRPGASFEAVVAAAKAAQAHDFIARLPDGYDTVLGERGVNLSGGQKQRLAIARALLLDPRILVLDEATSSVDMETEHEIQLALAGLMQGRTTFIIAQRTSSVRGADEICVLAEGRIVERGGHDELLVRGGLYRQIHDIQTGEQGNDGSPARAGSAGGRAGSVTGGRAGSRTGSDGVQAGEAALPAATREGRA